MPGDAPVAGGGDGVDPLPGIAFLATAGDWGVDGCHGWVGGFPTSASDCFAAVSEVPINTGHGTADGHGVPLLGRAGMHWTGGVTVTPPGKDAKAPRVATLTACKDASNSRLVDEETGLPPSKKELRQKLPRITVTWSLEQLPNKRWAISGGSAVEGC